MREREEEMEKREKKKMRERDGERREEEKILKRRRKLFVRYETDKFFLPHPSPIFPLHFSAFLPSLVSNLHHPVYQKKPSQIFLILLKKEVKITFKRNVFLPHLESKSLILIFLS